MESMETIPLRPVFENKMFQEANNPVQLAILKIVYQLCVRRILDTDYVKVIRRYAETNDVTFYKHRELIVSILKQVMPEIGKIKRIKVNGAIPGHKAQSRIAIESRLKFQKNVILSGENDVNKTNFAVLPKTHEETAWNKGQFDPVMRKMALKNNLDNKGKKRVFYDKPKE